MDKNNKEAKRFRDVLAEEVSDNHVAEKVKLLDDIFSLMQRSGRFSRHRICLRTTVHLSWSYFHDIIRYRWYHDMLGQRVDGRKQAAFTVKWILKFRPIVFTDASENKEEVTPLDFFGNELLALRTAISLAEIDDVAHRMPDDLFSLALYTMRYRAFSEDGILLWMETLFCSMQPEGAT